MDSDGKSDRVVMTRHADYAKADLAFYLGAGDEKLAPPRVPSFVKHDLTVEGAASVEAKSGSVAVTYGCGGCSNDFETTITVAWRHGDFLVAGYTYSWETRDAAGSCDINYLTGKGRITEGLEGDETPIAGTFAAIRLADWIDGSAPAVCGR